jgi:hypothetical protein
MTNKYSKVLHSYETGLTINLQDMRVSVNVKDKRK